MRASNLCNSSLSSAFMSSWASQAHASTCMSKALLSAPLEHSTCSYQQSHFSSRMKYRSSMKTCTSNSLDLVVTMSCGLTLHICLIIALSIRCRHWKFGFVNGQVLQAWSIALFTQHLFTQPCVLKKSWREESTSSNSLELLPGGFHMCCDSKFTATSC